MSGSERTYFEILGVSSFATYKELENAHQKILRNNATEGLFPFARGLAMKAVKDANIAWTVLSDWDERLAYNKKLVVPLEDEQRLKSGYKHKKDRQTKGEKQSESDRRPEDSQRPKEDSRKPFNPSRTHFGQNETHAHTPFGSGQTKFSTSSNFFGGLFGGPRETAGTCDSSPDDDGDNAQGADEGPSYPEAASRYMDTDTGTELDVVISEWRLKLHLSSKFRFLNDMFELSNPRNDDSVSFQIGLAYNTNSREVIQPTINEVTVKVESLPKELGREGGSWGIAHLQTVFKESISDIPTLTLTLTAKSLPETECHMPWEFGFDFDLNSDVRSHWRGSCLIFSREEFPYYFQDYVGADSSEHELKKEKGLNANVYKNLGNEKVLKMKYGEVTMWRLAAVGWRG